MIQQEWDHKVLFLGKVSQVVEDLEVAIGRVDDEVKEGLVADGEHVVDKSLGVLSRDLLEGSYQCIFLTVDKLVEELEIKVSERLLNQILVLEALS